MAGEPLNEAFVRHFGYLRERTGNDPRETIRALTEHPDLAASIKRLGEIFREVDRRRKTAMRRVISTSNPKFYEGFRDLENRWIPAYNKLRSHVYAEAAPRISRELARHHGLLVKRTGGDPNAVQQAL
jgi:molybdopterin converting factor small subunit